MQETPGPSGLLVGRMDRAQNVQEQNVLQDMEDGKENHPILKRNKKLKIQLPRKKTRRTMNTLKETTNVQQKVSTDADDEQNILDFEEESETEEFDGDAERVDKCDKILEEEKIWTRRGWSIDPRQEGGRINAFGPRLINIDTNLDLSELDMFLHFLPIRYIKETLIPATNRQGNMKFQNFCELTFQEFVVIFGLICAMEVYNLPERRIYWNCKDNGIFKALNYGKIITRKRFEQILQVLQYSNAVDKDQQILDFLEATNNRLKDTVCPGDFLCIDESMVKSYHADLKGKMKII